jgi:hypothetical protein
MRFFSALFSPRDAAGVAEVAYQKAMWVSDDLLEKLRHPSATNAASRALLHTLLEHQHNIPFLTSVYETVQEVDVPQVNGILGRH